MGNVWFGPPPALVLFLRHHFDINTFVETGTFHGNTAAWASQHFRRVITIERSESLHRRLTETPDRRENVTYLLGDSRSRLAEILPSLDGRALLWLDSHWCGGETAGATEECPLLEEIDVLRRSREDPFVLVDDARLFLKPPPPPHAAEQWPDIQGVLKAFDHTLPGGYVAIEDDVIVRVPAFAKQPLVEFFRTQRPQAQPVREGRVIGILRTIKRLWSR